MELFLNGFNIDVIFDGDDVDIDYWKYLCNPCELVEQLLLPYCDGCDAFWILVVWLEESGWCNGYFIVWGEWAFGWIYDFMFFDLY